MNRFVKTALALAVAGSAANAGSGDNEWLALDSEITGLASSLKPSQDGMSWAALLRGVYSRSSDDIVTGGGDDVSGFGFNDADLAFWGSQGSYRWRVSGDIDTGTLALEDAYVAWSCGGMFEASMGNMKPRVSRSNSISPEGLFFIDRTAIGSAFDSWDNGIALNGTWEMVNWFAYVMNGDNGTDKDPSYVLRGEFKLGEGAGQHDGARGAGDVMNGMVGVSFAKDSSVNGDAEVMLVDFAGCMSQLGFSAEVADLGEDAALGTDEDFSNLATALAFDADSTPWNAAVTFMVSTEWEIGARLEDLDTSDNDSILTLGANWYSGGGKWTAQWSDFDSDVDADTGSIIEIGYTVGASH